MKYTYLIAIILFYFFFISNTNLYGQRSTLDLALQLAQLDSTKAVDKMALNLLKSVNRFQNLNKILNDATLWDHDIDLSWEDMDLWEQEMKCRLVLEALKPNYTSEFANANPNSLANLIYTQNEVLKHQVIPTLPDADRIIYNKKMRGDIYGRMSSTRAIDAAADMAAEKTGFAGLPSEQQIILATASFIAERFKTELNMRFLEGMQRELDGTPLKLAFPNTHSILNINTLTHYQTLSVSMRTAFEQDFQTMPDNLLLMLNDTAQGLYRYVNAPEQRNGLRVVSGMLELFNGLRKGDDIGSGLELIANHYNSLSNNAFDRQINFAYLLVKNFPKQGFDKPETFRNLANPLVFKYFIALIFHQNEFLFQTMGVTQTLLRHHTASFFARWQQSFQIVRRLQRQIVALETKPNPNAHDLSQYIENLSDLIEIADHLLPTAVSKNANLKHPYLDLAKKAVQTYQALERREYGLVINHTLMVIKAFAPDTVHQSTTLNFQQLKKKREQYDNLVSRCSFYGAFMIDFIAAKTEGQLKNVISNYALPPGSYSIKRRSDFNITLNAYAGVLGGQEFIDKSDLIYKTRWTTAFSAPIGLDFSWSLPNGHSWSLFASMVDLGAVVSFRLNDPQTEPLPELNFKNIIAPGFYALYGLKNMPISVGATIQLAPRLRNYSATQQDIRANMAYRYGLVALVDIPIFNIYNRSGGNRKPLN
jgi:hypothetical protein